MRGRKFKRRRIKNNYDNTRRRILSWNFGKNSKIERKKKIDNDNKDITIRYSAVRNWSFKKQIYEIEKEIKRCKKVIFHLHESMEKTNSELIDIQIHTPEIPEKIEIKSLFIFDTLFKENNKCFVKEQRVQILSLRLKYFRKMMYPSPCFDGWLDNGQFYQVLFYEIIQYLDLRDIYYLMVSNPCLYNEFCNSDEAIWKPLALRYAFVFDDTRKNKFEYLTAVYANTKEKKWKDVVKIINTKYVHLDNHRNFFVMGHKQLFMEECRLFPVKYGLCKTSYTTKGGRIIKKRFKAEFENKVKLNENDTNFLKMIERRRALTRLKENIMNRLNIDNERIIFVNQRNKDMKRKKRKAKLHPKAKKKRKTKTKLKIITVCE